MSAGKRRLLAYFAAMVIVLAVGSLLPDSTPFWACVAFGFVVTSACLVLVEIVAYRIERRRSGGEA